MTEYDEAIWALRYRQYDDDDLRKVIARGGDHAKLAQGILTERQQSATTH